MCTAYRASFRHTLEEVAVCFSSFVCNNKDFLTSAFSKQISVISLEEWVLVCKLLTPATRKFAELESFTRFTHAHQI